MGRSPEQRDDWRARMAVRGGPLSHAIARSGWLVFAVLGALVMVGVAVLYAANPTADAVDNGVAANFVGAVIVMAPIGAAIGALLGLPAQFAARAWLRNPTDAERRAAREAVPAHGLRASGRWARSYEVCARSVTAYHEVVATLPDGAGRDWLAGIGETLDDELSESLRLARLGESLEPDGADELDGTALRVLDRLRAAEKSFDETTERAAAIALELRDESDFVRVRAQLDMLAEQTPHLRGSDPP
jgi:hypothetical protein